MKILMAALAALLFLGTLATPVEAKHKSHHYKKSPQLRTDRLPVIVDGNGNHVVQFSAKRHRYARRGSCDGFHRCRCGVTAARLHGLPLNYQGKNMKLAATYYTFPRTTCHAGAVGIPHAHHVYTVQQCNGDGTALVSDDAGTYTRRVSGSVFVDVNGSGTRTYAARSHRHHRHYASHRHYRYGYQYAASY